MWQENHLLDQQLLDHNVSGEIQKINKPQTLWGKGQRLIQIFSTSTQHKVGDYLRSGSLDTGPETGI